jgi:hypothetical protein
MDAAVASLIGAAIGSLAGVITALVSGWLQHRKDANQWQRDQIAEAKKWERDQIAEVKKWERDNIDKIYSDCLIALSNFQIATEHFNNNKDVSSEENKAFSELKMKLLQDAVGKLNIVISRQIVETGAVAVLKQMIRGFNTYTAFHMEAFEAVNYVSELASNDPRLNTKPNDK